MYIYIYIYIYIFFFSRIKIGSRLMLETKQVNPLQIVMVYSNIIVTQGKEKIIF